MTNEIIFKKALNRAIKNGYSLYKIWEFYCDFDEPEITEYISHPESTLGDHINDGSENFVNVNAIILSHDFAKAFWGEIPKNIITCPSCLGIGKSYDYIEDKRLPCVRCNGTKTINYPNKNSGWEYHLQQMVLERWPLKYLKKFLINT